MTVYLKKLRNLKLNAIIVLGTLVELYGFKRSGKPSNQRMVKVLSKRRFSKDSKIWGRMSDETI